MARHRRLCVRLDPEEHADILDAIERERREGGYGAVTRLVIRALRAYLHGPEAETAPRTASGAALVDGSPEFWERMRSLFEATLEDALARYALERRADGTGSEEEEALDLLRGLADDWDAEEEDWG